jgi:hypothetical protein
VPFLEGNDAYLFFSELGGFVQSTRPAEARGWLKWASQHFPNIMTRTNVGQALRMAKNFDVYSVESGERYGSETHTGLAMGDKAFFEKVVKDEYYRARTSIKRDFEGVPMVIAWQAVLPKEFDQPPHLREKLRDDFYPRWFADVQQSLQHYLNDDVFHRRQCLYACPSQREYRDESGRHRPGFTVTVSSRRTCTRHQETSPPALQLSLRSPSAFRYGFTSIRLPERLSPSGC